MAKRSSFSTACRQAGGRTLALALIFAAVLGALTVGGFEPFGVFWLPVITLAFLLGLWQRHPAPRTAAALGFAFGLGLFLCGASWVYVSLHEFGAMPAALAALATLIFCVILALFPAAAGWLAAHSRLSGTPYALLVAPALWVLCEWMRGWFLTGFPWLSVGYSQVPYSPLAGFAPVFGIYGVSLAVALSAGAVVTLFEAGRWKAAHSGLFRTIASVILHPSFFILVILWIGGYVLQQLAWTTPAGAPLTVSLLQGNIPQSLKWKPQAVRSTLETYYRMVMASGARLIILPETALPMFYQEVPKNYLAALTTHAQLNGGDLLFGVPEHTDGTVYYNSVVSTGKSPSQTYRKHHLVPFGEFLPFKPLFGWVLDVLDIPLSDFSRGPSYQKPMAVAGQQVAVDICYEDGFGDEIIRQLPQATLLVNVSNDAWFGHSIALDQHLQMSQARALETGRYMLRATNTGVTAVIDTKGRVVARAPEFTRAVVNDTVSGYRGATPFVQWGNPAAIILCLLLMVAAAWLGVLRQNR
ncbi:MAG TPA: apolipoprotein N-acyltransferase [Burkholderiales bacterium]|nr:apolipoprotein N-acyltransferase [Burkholderiales bacterium]